MKRNIFLIFITCTIVFSYIIYNEIKMRPKLNLINDGKKMMNIIENTDKSNIHKQILISNNSYKINNKKYNVSGYGVIFLEDDYSFFLQRDKMCIMKMNYSNDIMFQNTPCPEYRMIRQFKVPLETKNDGLYENKKSYYYKGKNAINYIEYDNDLYRILELNNNYIKIISSLFYDESNDEIRDLTRKEYNKTVNNNKSFIIKDKYYKIIELKNVIYESGKGTTEEPYKIKVE